MRTYDRKDSTLAIGLALAAFLATAGAKAEGTNLVAAAQCENQSGKTLPDARVRACSTLLASGDLSPEQEASMRTNRAWAFSLQGKMADARADYERALELSPNSHVIHNEMGLFLLRTGHLDGAIAQYDIALRLQPGAAYSLYGQGLAFIRKGETQKGEDLLAQARAANSNVDAIFRAIGLTP